MRKQQKNNCCNVDQTWSSSAPQLAHYFKYNLITGKTLSTLVKNPLQNFGDKNRVPGAVTC